MNDIVFAILGASGKIGYSTSLVLREAGVSVRAILRDASKASPLSAIGCDVALADLQDPIALGRAIAHADVVQIILPPPVRADDAIGEMRQSIENLAVALEQARPNRVLAISDYGAHVGEVVGMPAMFHIFEERIRQTGIPKVFLRSAEHMEGWGPLIPAVMATGILPSLHHPVETEFPTVSAQNVGLIAADLLLRGQREEEQIVHAEGPHRYRASDVAAALSQLLGSTITAQALPRSQWQESLERILSASAAKLVVGHYDACNKGGIIDVEPNKGEVRYGTTEMIDALRPFVRAAVGTAEPTRGDS